MRVLLDTFYLYRFMEEPGNLLMDELRVVSELEAELYVSAVSIWEMRLKHRARYVSGERKSPYDPADVVSALEDQDVRFLSVGMVHAARRLDTPLNHRDPFDELLLIQAQEEGLKLLTTDRRIIGHPLAITP